MLLLSTSTLQWYWLHRIFDFVKNSSYDGIDLCVDFELFDTFNGEYLKKLINETSVKIVSITAPERKLSTGQLEFILNLAEEIGVKIVNIHPPHRTEKEKDWFGEHLQILQKKHSTIMINIVNAPPKTWMFIISEYGDARPETIKKMTEHTALSISNIEPNSGVDLMKTFYLLGSTLEFVYLSDKKEWNEKLFLWEGLMPLESLLIKLKDVKYKWVFSLQIDPKSISAWNDKEVLENLEKAKQYLQKYFN